ncbi:MAG: universal stress protein E, partial [Halieaceae bacterium]
MGKILIVADQGDSCIATSRGLELADKLGHAVEVAAFVYVPLDELLSDKAAQVGMRQQILDRRRMEVQTRIDRFATPEQKVALKVVWLKDIYPWVIKRANSTAFDAVIKTRHESSTFSYTS